MALSYVQLRALVLGILGADNATKQALGQRFAKHLGLTPGPGGPDDGIDGSGVHLGRKVHFQCKLRKDPLDRDEARTYYSDLMYHAAEVSVMLAGEGYKNTFKERLFGHPDIGKVRIHLLTLQDLFEESPAYRAALQDMPALEGLAAVASSTA
jgi:hypothetical protein